jgi:hypothetical protein
MLMSVETKFVSRHLMTERVMHHKNVNMTLDKENSSSPGKRTGWTKHGT